MKGAGSKGETKDRKNANNTGSSRPDRPGEATPAGRGAGRVRVELQAIIGGLPAGPEEFRTAPAGNTICQGEPAASFNPAPAPGARLTVRPMPRGTSPWDLQPARGKLTGGRGPLPGRVLAGPAPGPRNAA